LAFILSFTVIRCCVAGKITLVILLGP